MTRRIAIVGGGPSGLSLARLLGQKAGVSATVFEATNRIGGKSETAVHGATIVEYGTCYTIRSHKIVLGWMKSLGIKTTGMGELEFEGEPFLTYIRGGSGASLAVQSWRFVRDGLRLKKALDRANPPAWAVKEAGETTLDWIRRRNLGKIERMLHRTQTALGYGFLDETAIIQTLRWNDLDLIISGVAHMTKMPVGGWSNFWERASDGLDIRMNAPVARIERGGKQPVVHIPGAEPEAFDEVVCAMPYDDFLSLAEPSETEREIASAIQWDGYTTSLVAVDDWFDDVKIHAYAEPTLPGAGYGRLLSARYEGVEPELGGAIYVTGQLTGDYGSEELKELLVEEITRRGGTVRNIAFQRLWRYFARYDQAAVRAGLLQMMRDVQGEQRTWYTGAAFSHEAVSNIVNFNARLAPQLVKAARRR